MPASVGANRRRNEEFPLHDGDGVLVGDPGVGLTRAALTRKDEHGTTVLLSSRAHLFDLSRQQER
jgi:hypothetical protein